MTFHRPYRTRHFQYDPGDYGFAFVSWTLSAIAILIASAAMFIGFEISSMIHSLA